jgi:hypothetical protein
MVEWFWQGKPKSTEKNCLYVISSGITCDFQNFSPAEPFLRLEYFPIPYPFSKLIHLSIHPVTLQPKLGLGLLCWGSVKIRFYGVRLLASRSTPRYLWGTHDFLLGFTPLAKGSSFKALETRPPSHSHLLHNPLYIASGTPRGGWEFGFAGRTCRLNTQEVFWHLTGHAYWHQNAPPEPYEPSVQSQNW